MLKREERQLAIAVVDLDEARDDLRSLSRGRSPNSVGRALRAVEDAQARLKGQMTQLAGLEVADVATYLGVSEPTVRTWLRRRLLAPIPGTKPLQVERASVRRVRRTLDELRERGESREWLQKLVDYAHDRADRRRPSVERGLDELDRGELEPA